MIEIIQQIGSYAGLAAIVGLAVMSALYFSQARDLRRLRESQSAPEAKPTTEAAKRPAAAAASTGATPAAAQGQAKPAATPSNVRPLPAGQSTAPATARTAASPGGVAPGTAAAQAGAGPPPAAAGEQGAAAAPAAGAKPAGTAQAPATKTLDPQDAATSGPGAKAPEASKAQAAASPSSAPTAPAGTAPPKPGPGNAGAAAGATAPATAAGRDRAPAPRPLPQRLADQASRPPGASPARRPPWYRRLAPRYIALILAGILVVATGAAFGVSALTGDAGSGDRPAGAERQDRARTPLDPSGVTVAVLNGTSVPGLAQQTADIVQSAGFARGTIANDSKASAESVVLFAGGQKQAAREVGKEVDISQVEPIDPTTEGLAGAADVVVIVGADKAQ